MEGTDSSAAIENMIQRGEVMLADLERLLETLHKQELISTTDQETLLELAWTKTINYHL